MDQSSVSHNRVVTKESGGRGMATTKCGTVRKANGEGFVLDDSKRGAIQVRLLRALCCEQVAETLAGRPVLVR